MEKRRTLVPFFERFSVPSLDGWSFYGKPVGCRPELYHDPEYRGWYLSQGSNRERHLWKETLIAVEGSCPFGWRHEVFDVRSGSVLFIEAMEYHSMFYPDGTPDILHLWLSWIEAEHRLIPSLVCSRNGQPVVKSMKHPNIRVEPYNSFLSLWDKIDGEDEVSQVNIERFKAAIIVVAMELLYSEEKRAEDPDDIRQVVHTIQSFIDSHPENNLSLDELATLSGYSKYHFHRMFKEATGETVHDYTTKRKTAHAYQLLKCGHSCSSVAESLGFTSLSSFSRWFKTYTGESPSQVELRQS